MNLLHDPWMPVRVAQGQRHWITPEQGATTDLKRYKPDWYIEIRPTGKR